MMWVETIETDSPSDARKNKTFSSSLFSICLSLLNEKHLHPFISTASIMADNGKLILIVINFNFNECLVDIRQSTYTFSVVFRIYRIRGGGAKVGIYKRFSIAYPEVGPKPPDQGFLDFQRREPGSRSGNMELSRNWV
jgi:hypothetical protein